MAREKPKSDHEILEHLWFAIIGTNENGIQSRVERIERTELPSIKKRISETVKWRTLERIVLVLIAVGGLVFGIIKGLA